MVDLGTFRDVVAVVERSDRTEQNAGVSRIVDFVDDLSVKSFAVSTRMSSVGSATFVTDARCVAVDDAYVALLSLLRLLGP